MWAWSRVVSGIILSNALLAVAVSLQGLCEQVLHFDTTLLLHAWKALVREVGRCRAALAEEEAVNDQLGLARLVQDLCTATAVTFDKCLELASSRAEQEFPRHLKACKHLLSLLIVLLRVSGRECGWVGWAAQTWSLLQDIDDGSGDTLPYYQVLLKLFRCGW